MAFPLPSLNDPHPPEDSAPHLTHHAEQHRCRHPRAQFWEGIGLSSPGHPCVRHGEGKASGGGLRLGGLPGGGQASFRTSRQPLCRGAGCYGCHHHQPWERFLAKKHAGFVSW